MRLSPDGTRLIAERTVDDTSDLWVYETTRRLTDGPNSKSVQDWSRDGRHLIYSELGDNQRDLWILPFDRPNGRPVKPIPFLQDAANEASARFSPDGKWIAYTSDNTGRAEAYIRAFPGGPPGQSQVSSGGAAFLTWRVDGRELFYRSPSRERTGNVSIVPIRLLPDRPEIGATQIVLRSGFFVDTGNVSDDGQRLLVFARPGETPEAESSPLTVLVNWQAAIK